MGKDTGEHTGDDVLVSVVVATYGRPERLQKLLEQLLAQEVGKLKYEVIVVDDGSPESVEPLVSRLSEKSGIPLRCLRKENGGPALARNYGARAAQGEYLIFLDDDMLVRPDFICGHILTQEEHGPGAVNCHFEWQVDAKPEPFRRWYLKLIGGWNSVALSHLNPVAAGVYLGHSVTAANLSVKREHFERVGGFDSSYIAASCEDQAFSIKLRQIGVPVFWSHKTIAIHVETHISLEGVCRRQGRGAIDGVRFVQEFPELLRESQLPVVNGPISWKGDSFILIGKKLLKQIIVSRFFSPIVFKLVRVMEIVAPKSAALQKSYDLIVGAHIQQGWREGLKRNINLQNARR